MCCSTEAHRNLVIFTTGGQKEEQTHSQPVIMIFRGLSFELILSLPYCLLPSITSTSLHFQVSLSRLYALSHLQHFFSIHLLNWIQFYHHPTGIYEESRSAWPAVRKRCQHHGKDEKQRRDREKKRRGGGSEGQKEKLEETVRKLGQVMKILQEDKDKGKIRRREREKGRLPHSVAVT